MPLGGRDGPDIDVSGMTSSTLTVSGAADLGDLIQVGVALRVAGVIIGGRTVRRPNSIRVFCSLSHTLSVSASHDGCETQAAACAQDNEGIGGTGGIG